jgi:DNA-binding NarL/FixJ family response regulator
MAEAPSRVLVVDDERFFREAIRDALAEAGIECDVAETAAQALAAARDPKLAVVVLDVGLPDSSGVEVLRRLRAERPSLRVIVLSAHTDQEIVLEALRLDASDYLAKPLHDEELVLAVRRALAGFDVESGFLRLRDRLRRLEAHVSELASRLDEADDPEALEPFASAVVSAISGVLDASKASLMLLDEEAGELRVVSAAGAPIQATEMDPVALGEGVAGMALSLGEAVIVDDVYTDPRFAGRTVHERYESGSLAVAPLRCGQRPLGVLCATDRLGGAPFGEDELALLRILAVPAARFLAASVRAREAALAPLPAAAEDGDADLAREICEALTAEVEPERVLAAALAPVSRRLGDAGVALHLIDNQTGQLVLEGQVEGRGPGDRERLPRQRGLTATVLQTGGLVATDEPGRDPRFEAAVDTASDGALRPLLCVPLRLRGKVLGVLRAFPERGVGASARTGEILSAALSAAVRNVLLYRSLLEAIDEVAQARREAGS